MKGNGNSTSLPRPMTEPPQIEAGVGEGTSATRQDAPSTPPISARDQSIAASEPERPGFGDWHKAIPRGRLANVKWRRHVWGLAGHDRDIQAHILRCCREDLLYFINGFVWLFDPQRPASLPWTTWPYQDDALCAILRSVWGDYDLLIEKSRDMGASWMVLVTYLWLWLFYPQMAFLCISRTEDLVDRTGDPDTLFWKFRFALANLPAWMRPPTREANLHIENLANGSVIDGRATSKDAARAGRRKSLLVDEHASIEQAADVEMATADVSANRLRVSTPKGMNTFGRLRHSGKVKVLTLHWSKHPIKSRGLYTSKGVVVEVLDGYRGPVTSLVPADDAGEPRRVTYDFPDGYPFVLDGRLRSPWYDGECVRRGSDIEVAQELDIDYLRSGHAWFDGNVVARLRATTVRSPDLVGDLVYRVLPEDRIALDGFVASPRGMLRLWCPLGADGRPSQHANYAVACDISEGTGASNSVASVYDCTNGRKVAELVTAQQSPEHFARTVVALCNWFAGGTGWPFLVWEQTGPGLIFGREVHRLGYTYVYFQRREDEVSPRRRDQLRIPGWPASKNNKFLLLGDYRRDLGLGTFINPSAAAVDELLQYVMDDEGCPLHERLVEEKSGARLAHGDRVIADALVNLARKEQPKYVMPARDVPRTSYIARRHAALANRLRERDE